MTQANLHRDSHTKKTTSAILFWMPVFCYLIFYLFISRLFLDAWPLVHSDESWLAALSRDMLEARDFGITESFFDAKMRVPHAIRIFFHGLQALFIRLFGFDITTVRMLSLLAGGLCLLLVFQIGALIFEDTAETADTNNSGFAGRRASGLALMILISLDPAFLYASHFARQEILMAAALLFCLRILFRAASDQHYLNLPRILLLASVTGLSVGIHPNSFLCASTCGAVLVLFILERRPRAGCQLLLYALVTGLIAAVFVWISFSFTPTFLPDYFRYGGDEFQLSSSISGRFSEFVYYFQSVFHQESGTYLLPDLRVELAVFGMIGLLSALALLFLWNSQDEAACIWCSQLIVLLTAILGLTVGMLIIGRYNQTSILFYVLPGWFLTALFLKLFEGKGPLLAMTGISAFLLVSSSLQIRPWLSAPTYENYLAQLSRFVPADAGIIGNLNTAFYFDPGVFRDYRNLPYLENEQQLKDYVKKNKIQYILYTDELDYIYENRPYYNVIYGNSEFIRILREYCQNCCRPAGAFQNSAYGSRILPLAGNPDYGTVTVYQVIP